MHGIVDEKIDVFSFGVLLLEIITGRRPIDSSKQSLLLWVCKKINPFISLMISILLLKEKKTLISSQKKMKKVTVIHFQAMPLMESGEITRLADPRMEGKYDLNQLRRVVLTASYCVRQSSIWRPTMSEVHEALEYKLELHVECQPCLKAMGYEN